MPRPPPPVGGPAAPFERRVLVLPPGSRRPYRPEEWWDALVSIDRGRIQLECVVGPARTFGRGDLLWLGGLGLRSIHNPGPDPAVLTAVSRRRPAGSSTRRRLT
jgi:hypothetical protein